MTDRTDRLELRTPVSPMHGALFIAIGWLLPGAGHVLIGGRARGLALFLLVGGTFAAGLLLSEFEALSTELHPYAWYAELGVGSTIPLTRFPPRAVEVLNPDESVRKYMSVPPEADLGVLFCAIAGLLNVLVLLDLIERSLGGPWAKEAAAP